MKGLIEITLLDSTHNLGLRCKLERDLFRVVERLSADTGEATCKETVNAIGLTRRIGKQDGNFRPLVGRIPRLSTPVLPPQGALLRDSQLAMDRETVALLDKAGRGRQGLRDPTHAL